MTGRDRHTFTGLYPDAHVARLADLFAHDTVWQDAMARIRPGAMSAVYFSHRPGETWHFVKEEQGVRLRPGPAAGPDFAFCFTPGAIDELAAVDGGIDGVAVVLFDLMLSEDPARRVGFRVLAPFWRLVRHGHLRLLLEAGPRVLAYGAGHGIRTLGQLRAFVATLRATAPEEVAPHSGGC